MADKKLKGSIGLTILNREGEITIPGYSDNNFPQQKEIINKKEIYKNFNLLQSQIQRMKSSNNPNLFLSVIETNKGIIYKIANSYCNKADDRKDLIQEIIIQLWNSFDNYTNKYKYSTWMYRIALNVAISFYRKETRRKQVSNSLSDGILNFADTNDANEKEENIEFLKRFISELKDLDKALMLLYLEEKSQKEIAEIVGISETNVATKIGRIKKILKQKFSTINT